jgi:NTP pyrophosphatase (non-canonical NTP hydrolase)
MTIQDLIENISAFNAARNWDVYHTPKNLATSVMIEAAELAECFQWLTPEESYLIEDKAKVSDEIADVLIYLLNLCDKMKIDPICSVNEKLQKKQETVSDLIV